MGSGSNSGNSREGAPPRRFDLARASSHAALFVVAALGLISVVRCRDDALAEASAIGLVGFGAVALLSPTRAFRAPPAGGIQESAARRKEFALGLDSALVDLASAANAGAIEGAKFHRSLTTASQRLATAAGPALLSEIIATLIRDNGAMQLKIKSLTQRLERSRAQIVGLRSRLSKAEENGNRDGLTEIGNRHCFDARLEAEIRHAKARRSGLCVALADIDQFKAINDKFGHLAGDMVLKSFAQLLTLCRRPQDAVARLGGDEFALILPGATLAEAAALVDHMRRRLETRHWAMAADNRPIGIVTASFGVAALASEDVAEDLVRRADAKLYEAKSSGRNRVAAGA